MNRMSQFLAMKQNPNVAIQSMMQQNPAFAQKAQAMQNMMNGSKMSQKDFAMQWFKQQGISEDQVMQLARQMGLK